MQIVLSQWSPMGNHPPSPFLLTNQKGNVRVWLLILGGKETEILGFLHDSVHQRKFFFLSSVRINVGILEHHVGRYKNNRTIKEIFK